MRTSIANTVAAQRALAALAGLLCAALAGACLLAVPARATEVHVLHATFGGEGAGAGQLELAYPAGVAVNDAAHTVYVADAGNHRVQIFNSDGSALLGQFDGAGAPTGVFSKPTSIAVDNSGDPLDPSKEDVYVVDYGHGVIDKLSPSGTYLGQITGASTPGGAFTPNFSKRAIEGIAVDTHGNIWVEVEEGWIYELNDELENAYQSQRISEFGAGISSLAVDAETHLYVNIGPQAPGQDQVAKLDSAGATLASDFGEDEHAYEVAVDPVRGEVFLASELGDVATFSLAGALVETFGTGQVPAQRGSVSLGVDGGTGTVYVTDSTSDKVYVYEGVLLPTVTLGSLSEQGPKGATVNGTINPEGRAVMRCAVEYATAAEFEATKTYSHSVACSPASLGSGTAPVPVSARLGGLAPETSYHYQLVAENSANIPSSTGDQQLFAGPRVSAAYASDVAASSATLQATVDPNGADTHYYFEYGPTTAYGSHAPALPGADLGSAPGAQSVLVHLTGLQPTASYHYRLLAVQDGETFAQRDQTFTTEPVGVLSTIADARQWELVSPANKGGALFEPNEQGGDVQAATDGSGITYLVVGPANVAAAGAYKFSQLLSRRGPTGWSTIDVTLPRELPENEEGASQIATSQLEYDLFSPGLSLALVQPPVAGTPPLSRQVGERTLYLLDTHADAFAPLVGPFNTPEGATLEEAGVNRELLKTDREEWQLHVTAATPDLAHIVIDTPKALTPEAIDEETAHDHQEGEPQRNLYEWGGGQLQLVNILPDDGEVAHGPGARVGLAGTLYRNGVGRGGPPRNISSDGRRIAWTWGETPYTQPHPEGFKGLFVRDMVEGRTVQIGGADALYQTMNADGSKIFYTEGGDLHVFEFESARDLNLTAAHGPEPDAGVQNFISDVSEDGSYVYFVATGTLVAGRGASGADNLYLLHDTASGWTTTFIAELSPQDRPSWESNAGFDAPGLGRVGSRVSPNGRYLAFMSDRSLTGYDNLDAVSGQPDEEAYEYDAVTGRLVCASCNPTNARPHGVLDTIAASLLVDRHNVWNNADSRAEDPHSDHWLAASMPGWDEDAFMPTAYQPKYLSDSGRLFFDSPDALVPGDTNGLEDVYEFEPEGVGGCTPSTSSSRWTFVGEVGGSAMDGCLGLISSGTAGAESAFYDASENGDDVFFDSTSRLSAADYDTAYDIYDAHVCSSETPCASEPVSPPPCSSGDGCKSPPTPQPEFYGAPASQTFHGIGDLSPSSVAAAPAGGRRVAAGPSRALKECRKLKRRARRVACERRARARSAGRQARRPANRRGSR